jgi:hypothetical protein
VCSCAAWRVAHILRAPTEDVRLLPHTQQSGPPTRRRSCTLCPLPNIRAAFSEPAARTWRWVAIGHAHRSTASITRANLRGSEKKPSFGCIAARRMGSLVAIARARRHAAGPGAVRVRHRARLRLFPDHRHRLVALRDGERRLRGDCRGWQRRDRRCVAVHGRPVDNEQGGCAKRRARMPAEGLGHEGGIR